MRVRLCVSVAIGSLIGPASGLLKGQEPAASVSPSPAVQRVIGEVLASEAGTGRLELKTDTGETVTLALGETSSLHRTKPGATDLRDATPITLAEVAVGDRVLARGIKSAEGLFTARQLVVMSSGDLAAKRERERSEWQRRGIAGIVKAVDPIAKEITLEQRGFGSGQVVILPTADRPVAFKRYAPDSVRFADAQPSALGEVQVGDQLRALGERNTDGSRFTPEQVVTGSFRSVTALLTGIDRERGTLAVTELASRTKLTIVLRPDTTLKRLTPEVAARLSTRSPEGASGEGRRGEQGASGAATGGVADAAPPSGQRPGREGGGARRFGGAGRTLGDVLDRLPSITTADLQTGSLIVLSSTRGADPTRLTAIAVVAGIEALAPETPRRGRESGVTLGLAADALDLGMDLQ